jgi:hypothetical protein
VVVEEEEDEDLLPWPVRKERLREQYEAAAEELRLFEEAHGCQ